MLKTVEGYYRRGTVELSERPDELEEAPVLVTFLPPSTHREEVKQPLRLYGTWQDRMPPDLDVDAALRRQSGRVRGERQ